ncbi:helix-turn-helix DNA binding domain protein [Microbacterium phage Pumpernickel]|uniref:Helix-turn-helix DNA binding domain protein n=1 Tax=Microbacterium phage Pumpernickel TaxID=2885983 RepID=A0AAE8Y775_9CAUD|nr:helix-turn-helix DNA binding domain protein [Microbacterium phage Pumpernickel]UDL15954.1 helix-turn-helix DNA binding domain protein [Microbacterium phage Pumpernickel]
MTTNDEDLLNRYEAAIRPHLELAKKAYGSRDTQSPQHDASREYTRLLKEFHKAGGSLLKLAERLGVSYAGLNRRVRTAEIKPSSGRPRKKFPQEVYDAAVADILSAKSQGTEQYHKCLEKHYDAGLSLTKIARDMGLSSAMPLYYGVNRRKGKK